MAFGDGIYDNGSRPRAFGIDMPASEVRLNVNLDLTSTCNLSCVQCWITAVREQGFTFKNEMMPLEVFEKILTELEEQIDRLSLSCGYEPFVNPNLPEYFDVIRRHPPRSTNIYTNGVLIRQEMAEMLIDVGIERLTLSLDGATRESFERIRVGAKWERFVEVLAMLRDTKRRRGADHPVLRFNWTLMRSTVQELPLLVRLAAEHGVTEILCQHLLQYEGFDLDGEAAHWDDRPATHQAITDAVRLAAEHGVEFVHLPAVHRREPSRFRLWFRDLDPPPRDRPLCEQPWSVMRVAPNGAIHPCDGWFTEGIMGNWATQSWEEIWNGPAYRRLRRAHWRGAAPLECCRNCSDWAPNRNTDMRARRLELETGRLIDEGWFTGIRTAKRPVRT
jgi:radical SAM protein with 4Fe4S-binding SPASM domain